MGRVVKKRDSIFSGGGGDWAKRPFYRGGGRLKFYGAGQNRG